MRTVWIFAIFFFQLAPLPFTELNSQKQISKKVITEIPHKDIQIYLQTSKPIYEAGEDLWFKAYLLDQADLTPSAKDKNLYIQLATQKGKVPVWEEVYPIVNGFSDGHIPLDIDLNEGVYLLLAYSANSISSNTKTYKSAKRITIKKNIVPKLLLNTTFKKNNYKKNDTITMDVIAQSIQGDIIANTEIRAEMEKNGVVVETLITETGADGVAGFSFSQLATQDTNFRINIKTETAQRSVLLNLPYIGKENTRLEFYPEGGHLVNGVLSKIAFKATNGKGLPVNVSGKILVDGVPSKNFKSVHAGMGSLFMIPETDKNYVVQMNGDSLKLYNFPEVQPSGVVLKYDGMTDETLNFTVNRRGPGSDRMQLRLASRGRIQGLAKIDLSDAAAIKIPLKEISQGIVKATLLDGNGTALAERLLFVDKGEYLNIETKMAKQQYGKREKVMLEIRTTDGKGNPVSANLGVSVYDRLFDDDTTSEDIVSFGHLSSQIKGKVYRPNYYFGKKNTERLKHLDLLLLTQGWRKYIWDELKTDNSSNEPVILNDFYTGRLFPNKSTTSSLKNILIGYNPLEESKRVLIELDEKNNFKILPSHLSLFNGDFYVKSISGDKKPNTYKTKTTLENPFGRITKWMNQVSVITVEDNVSLKSLQSLTDIAPNYIATEINILDEVIVTKKRRRKYRNKYIQSLDSIAKMNGTTDYVCLDGYLNCKSHATEEDKRRKPVEGKIYLKKIFAPGTSKGNGMGWFTVKQLPPYSYPQFSEKELMDKFNLTQVKGYYPKKIFYTPDYEELFEKNNPLPDYRNTLVWFPQTVTNMQGKTKIEFYTPDIGYTFKITLEGQTSKGLLGNHSSAIHVTR